MIHIVQMIEICHLGFQRAFDSASHRIPDQKLKAFRLEVNLNSWKAHSLKGRSFRARVDGRLSRIGLLHNGFPKGLL